ncbi:quinol:cytochrome C oxidoreductase [uncultured Polaribacter sp.]|uniref:quinol:cytochrome C oxidoreductase n=1 Tax=uncultured Polaribacter sp. TaxID=174711 RepID=UPI002617C9C7|nr:quinol:cytochrome C oxidoreductase [uncultured Polaribacter sp.]
MYQFSGKLKTFSLALIIIGVVGIAFSFYSGSQKTIEDARHAIETSHSDGHGNTHAETDNAEHSTKTVESDHNSASGVHVSEENIDKTMSGHGAHDDDSHAEHVLHQMQNRPWSAFYVALFFSLGLTLLILAFYAIQRVAQVGWSVVILRVMEAITANLLPVSIIMIVVLVASVMHLNHLFPWMAEGTFDPTSPNYDPIVDGKSWWMNTTGFLVRSIAYLVIWNAYRFIIRKGSIKEDTANDGNKTYKKNYNTSVVFLFLFMISESMMSWDWIMGLDPHWFSTLFGWYVLATLLVSALTVIAFVTIYLRSKGAIPGINDSHIHDLAKFMFGFSVFWTYLWFAQFMLIWYANIPEETTYFVARFTEYKVPFLAMVVMNFVFPILLLINSDFKSKPWFVFIGGTVILIGHYVDVFIMVMPSTVGAQWSFGIPEISSLLFFIGLLIYTTFSAFAKANPIAKGNPFLEESEHFHYYNIEHTGEGSADHH